VHVTVDTAGALEAGVRWVHFTVGTAGALEANARKYTSILKSAINQAVMKQGFKNSVTSTNNWKTDTIIRAAGRKILWTHC